MASSAGVRVKGADRFALTLAAVAVRLGHLGPVNTEISAYAAGRARAYAPVRTGRLRASLTPSRTDKAASVSTGVAYAGVQEFGWPGHNIRPHRFMARAYAETEPRAIDAHLRNVNRLLATVKGA